jgi:hypothetical protein
MDNELNWPYHLGMTFRTRKEMRAWVERAKLAELLPPDAEIIPLGGQPKNKPRWFRLSR